jgi:UPF0271 protein
LKVSDLVGSRRIDINVDIGEGFPYDEDLLRFATSANICCGAHAGSERLTLDAIELCASRSVRVGAHPGYPDRATMGRERVSKGLERRYFNSIFDQISWFCRVAKPHYIKPHGGFYNDTALVLPPDWEVSERKQPLATKYENGGLYLALHPGMQSLSMLLRVHHLPLMGLEVTAHKILAERAGQSLIREGFADRAYHPDGTLVSRSAPGAVHAEIFAIRQQVSQIAPFVDSICVHGDTPNCVEIAEAVFAALIDEGFDVAVDL